MDTLMKLRLRLIAGLAISLAPAVVNANSVARRSSVPPHLLTGPSAVDLCRAGFQSQCQKLSPMAIGARQQVQFLGTAPTSPPATPRRSARRRQRQPPPRLGRRRRARRSDRKGKGTRSSRGKPESARGYVGRGRPIGPAGRPAACTSTVSGRGSPGGRERQAHRRANPPYRHNQRQALVISSASNEDLSDARIPASSRRSAATSPSARCSTPWPSSSPWSPRRRASCCGWFRATTRSTAVTLFECFGRLQIGLACDRLRLIAARILNAVLILLYQLQALLGDPLLRLVSPFLGTVSLSCG